MRKLEELLNLPSASEEEPGKTSEETIEENKELIAEIDEAIDKIDTALPLVKDLTTADDELDSLSDLARTTFEDLTTLAMNVEPRYSGTIIQSAATLLGHAVTAKQAKIDKKLRMIDLQLKKMGLDQKQRALDMKENEGAGATPAEGVVLDRNELLKQILGKTEQK